MSKFAPTAKQSSLRRRKVKFWKDPGQVNSIEDLYKRGKFIQGFTPEGSIYSFDIELLALLNNGS